FDEQDVIFHGKIEFIRALVTYEATNGAGLKKAFHAAVDDYLKTCKQHSIEPETPFKGSLNARLDSDLHRRVAIAATQHHISINKYIAEQLDRVVDE
ncbi:MAG: HicB family protein, partial [uncultured bacterium]